MSVFDTDARARAVLCIFITIVILMAVVLMLWNYNNKKYFRGLQALVIMAVSYMMLRSLCMIAFSMAPMPREFAVGQARMMQDVPLYLFILILLSCCIWEMVLIIHGKKEKGSKKTIERGDSDTESISMEGLSRTITESTTEREILEAKVRLHSDFGGVLLLAKRYHKTHDETIRDQLITEWSRCLTLLRANNSEKSHDHYKTVFDAAADVGIKISVNGGLPDEPVKKRTVAMAIGECMTNAIRHANGDTLYIEADKNRVCIRNNGIPPTGKIIEAGGLIDLRKVAEASGIKMEILSEPEFVLILYLDDKR